MNDSTIIEAAVLIADAIRSLGRPADRGPSVIACEAPGIPMPRPTAIIAVEDDDHRSHSVYRCYRCGEVIMRAVMQIGHLHDDRIRSHAGCCPNRPESR